MTGPILSRTADAILEFDIDDTVSLYRPGEECVVVLNASARQVWRLLETPISQDNLVDRLAVHHDVAPAAIRMRVEGAVAALVAQGLVATAR